MPGVSADALMSDRCASADRQTGGWLAGRLVEIENERLIDGLEKAARTSDHVEDCAGRVRYCLLIQSNKCTWAVKQTNGRESNNQLEICGGSSTSGVQKTPLGDLISAPTSLNKI